MRRFIKSVWEYLGSFSIWRLYSFLILAAFFFIVLIFVYKPFSLDFFYYYQAAEFVNNISLVNGLLPTSPEIREILATRDPFYHSLNFLGSYSYPPPSVLFFLPWRLLSPEVSSRLWYFFNISLWLFVLFLFSKKEKSLSFPSLLAVSLFFTPFWRTLDYGQINLVIFASLSLAYLYRKHPFLSGVLAAFAAIFKISPGILIFHFLSRRQFLKAGIFLSSLFSMLLIWIGFFGLSTVRPYLDRVSSYSLIQGMTFDNVSLYGFFTKIFCLCGAIERPFGNALFYPEALYLAIASGILLVLSSTYFSLKIKEEFASFSLMVITIVFVPFLTWTHAYVLLLIPVFYLLTKNKVGPIVFILFLFIVHELTIIFMRPPINQVTLIHFSWFWTFIYSLPFLAAVFLYIEVARSAHPRFSRNFRWEKLKEWVKRT